MATKTIMLTGAEVEVTGLDGTNVHIRNDGTSTVYAAKSAGIIADADGVLSIPAGCSAVIYSIRGTVHLLGTGIIQLVSSDYAESPFKSSVTPGSVTGEISRAVSNPNLLINPDFKVNQYGKSGVITTAGYFIDRWKLVDGSVTINDDGSLTLNGTIAQILESPAGEDVSVSASAGTASYDNTTGTFTLTASDSIISWAKLEAGSISTRFLPTDPATELLKCQRYYNRYRVIATGILGIAMARSATELLLCLSLPSGMRIVPTVSLSTALVELSDGEESYAISGCSVYNYSTNSNAITLKIISNDLTVGKMYFVRMKSTSAVEFSSEM